MHSPLDGPEAGEDALSDTLADDLASDSRDVWDRAIAVNLTSAFDNGGGMPVDGGRIVLIISVAYQRCSYDHLSYFASKGDAHRKSRVRSGSSVVLHRPI